MISTGASVTAVNASSALIEQAAGTVRVMSVSRAVAANNMVNSPGNVRLRLA